MSVADDLRDVLARAREAVASGKGEGLAFAGAFGTLEAGVESAVWRLEIEGSDLTKMRGQR